MSPTKVGLMVRRKVMYCVITMRKDRPEDLVPALRNHVLPWAVRRSAAS
jgi:hypothetical protein